LPKNIATYINGFDSSIPDEEYNDMRYSYRVLYVPKSVNHKGQADKVIEFIPANSPEAEKLNKEYVLIKEKEKKKYLPSEIWKKMQDKGYIRFGQHQHTQLWKSLDAKNKSKGFGVMVVDKWYWYENWFKKVEEHCRQNEERYK